MMDKEEQSKREAAEKLRNALFSFLIVNSMTRFMTKFEFRKAKTTLFILKF